MQLERRDIIDRMKNRRIMADKSMKSDPGNFLNNNSFCAYTEQKYIKKSLHMNLSRKINIETVDTLNDSLFDNNSFNVVKVPRLNNSTHHKRTIVDKSATVNEINENIEIDDPSIFPDTSQLNLNDTSLTRELQDLSAEIARLHFNPKVYDLVEDMRSKHLRRSKENKQLNNATENMEFHNYKNINNQINDNTNINENELNKIVENQQFLRSRTNNADTNEMHKDDNKNNETQDKAESLENVDYNDLNNVTFCKKEKTSSVSSYSISTDEESKGIRRPLRQEQQIVEVELNSGDALKSTLNETNKCQTKLKTGKLKGKHLYPDLTSQDLDEIRKMDDHIIENNVSLTPKKTKFGVKLRRLFNSPENTSVMQKSKNGAVSKKSNSNKRIKVFTDKLKNKFANHPKQPVYLPDLNFPITPIKHEKKNDQIQELMQELKIQQTIIHQARKALMLCQNMKEFNSSEEQIESEKSLLLGTVKAKATLDEIDRLMLEKTKSLNDLKENDANDARGEIIINCIELLLKRDILNELKRKEQTEFFVVVIIHKLFVWSSKVIYNPFNNLNIVIPEKVVLSDVSHDFNIKVQVYSMKLENCIKLSHETKYRINGKCGGNSKNNSQNNFMRNFSRRSKREKNMMPMFDTQFELVGQLELGVEDLHLKSPWLLDKVPKTTSLNNLINFDLKCNVKLRSHHSGFVNHGFIPEGYAMWNRRWCVLNEHVLKMWNYPQQEDEQPILIIDLINCVLPKIKVANRGICAKPKTLLIETISRKTNSLEKSTAKKSRKIQRHFFSFDTNQELNEWMSNINKVLSSLHKWNKTLYEESQLEDSCID